jgi:nucleoside-diphosphate-sugar epimerase
LQLISAFSQFLGHAVCRALSEAGYIIRALTKTIDSPAAIALQEFKNLSIVKADISSDDDELAKAFEGAYGAYINTIPDVESIISKPKFTNEFYVVSCSPRNV